MTKILIVDDDVELTENLKQCLSREHYVVDTVYRGDDALQLLTVYDYDLLILDWSLPGLSGPDVCSLYRAKNGQARILFMTGRTEVSHLEVGFKVGADDYLRKPFDIRELLARCRGLLKRQGYYEAELKIKELVFYPDSHILQFGEQKAQLRPKEAALLEFLLRHPDRIYSAQELLDKVWSAESSANRNTVRTWIGFLRHKLAEFKHPDLILTVAGAGYILKSD